MQIINQKAHINKDGILKLNIPTELSEADVELVVVINPIHKSYAPDMLEAAEIQMLEERWEEYKRNPSQTNSWEQVKESISKKYGI